MKVNPKFLTLMVALAAGAASAATTNTTAGTVITNTATASYTDPSDSTTKTTTSNDVKTTVLPKPAFDIVYSDATPDGNTYATTPVSKTTTNAVPGQQVETAYTVVNSGNVALTVALTSVVGGDAAAADVKYYLSTDTARTNPITSVSLPVDVPGGADEGMVAIVQVITVPSDATPAKAYGASPEGSVVGTGTGTVTGSTTGGGTANFSGNGVATGTTVYEDAKVQGADLQFAKVTLFSPNVDNSPNPPTNPINPPTGPVDVPTLPVGPDPTPNTPPVQPATPGYLDPNNPNTPITVDVAGDIQKAYPKADADNLPDTVTFTNALTNKSTTQADSLQLFPTGSVNPSTGALLNGWTFDPTTATFTQNAGQPNELKVQFLNTDGSVVTVKAGAVYPTLDVPANSTAYYQTKVTYPDPDDSAVTPRVAVVIDVDSTKDAGFGLEAGGQTVNLVYPAAAQFGDSTAGQGASPTPAPVETVTPNGGASGGVNSPADTDPTASFPMDLVNNGQYNDTFILSATTTVPGATVKYFYANGTELTKITTGPDAGKYVSEVVGAGTELKVYAVIDVPAGTATGDYTVSQTATGYYSTIAMTDTNDIIRVSPFGKVGVAKFVATPGENPTPETVLTPSGVNITGPNNYTATGLSGAKPGDNISYRIIAKNEYNTAVANFFISDTVPANTTFVSVALTTAPTSPATTIYKVGADAWSATAPAAGAAAGTDISIAVDNDGATGGYAPSPLPSGATLSADFVVTVK